MRDLYDILKENASVVYKNSSGTEIITRCPHCFDSIKRSDHGHFYIKNEFPYPYYCQRCNSSGGMLSVSDIRDMGVTSRDFLVDYSINSIQYLNDNRRKIKTNSVLDNRLSVMDISSSLTDSQFNDSVVRSKLNYMSDRLGREFTKDDITKFKLIPSTKFLVENNYDVLNANIDLQLNQGYLIDVNRRGIGFMSADKSMINYRNVESSHSSWRYNIFHMVKSISAIGNMYIIQNDIDMKRSTSLEVYITEGCFDIIGLYTYLKETEFGDDIDNNRLFVSCNGKGFSKVITALDMMGFLGYKINIFPDNEKYCNSYYFNSIIRRHSDFHEKSDFRVFKNVFSGEKDCGVPKERIRLSQFILD